MEKVTLTTEEVLRIENNSLKQETLNLKFNDMNKELLRLREESTKFLEDIALKNGIELVNKKVSLDGNILTFE